MVKDFPRKPRRSLLMDQNKETQKIDIPSGYIRIPHKPALIRKNEDIRHKKVIVIPPPA